MMGCLFEQTRNERAFNAFSKPCNALRISSSS